MKTLLAFLLLLGSALAAVGPVTESYFGMTEHNVQQNGFPRVPVGILRINNDQFNQFGHGTTNVKWLDLETCDGGTNQASACYHFGLLDYLVSSYTSAGYSIIYTFGYTPSWASSNPSGACQGTHPAGSCYPPATQQYWQDFVTVMVSRYDGAHGHGRIKYWGVWNEPNSCTSGVGAFWYGCGSTVSLDDLAQMALDAYPIVHAVSGNLTITPDPQGPSADSYLGNYLTEAATLCSAIGNGVCADVIGFHAYVNAANLSNMDNTLATSMIDGIKTAMTAHSVGSLPLWDTESGWGLNSEYPNYDLEASFVVRHHLLEWSKGVKHGSWWAWSDSVFGTLYNGTSIGQAGVAWQQLHDWVIGGTLNSPCTATGTVWSCSITQSNGSAAMAMWDTSQTCTGGTFTAPGTCVAPLRTVDLQYARYLTIENSTSHAILVNQVPVGIKPVLLLRAATVQAGENQYYVNFDSGSDSNPGTQSQPWGTLQHADSALTLGTAGTVVNVLPSSFSANQGGSGQGFSCFHPTKSGASGRRIVYRSTTPYAAKITCADPSSSGTLGVHISAAWVDFVGFDVSGTGHLCDGIRTGGANTRILNNYIHNIPAPSSISTSSEPCGSGPGGAGIETESGVSDVTIDSNIVDNIGFASGTCNYVHGIYGSGPRVIVTNNIVSRACGWGIQFYHATGTDVIANNTVFNNLRGGILTDAQSGSTFNRSTILNNLVIRNGQNVNGTGTGGSCSSGCAHHGIIQQPGGDSTNLYENNILIGNLPANILYNGSTPASSGNKCDVAGTGCASVLSGSQATLTNLVVNYTGDKSGDYHLKTGSVAIGAGSRVCVAGGVSPCAPAADFDNKVRANPPSVGAFEGVGAAVLPPAAPTGLTAIVQ